MLLRHLKGRIWLQVQSLLGGSLRPSKVLLIALFLCATLSAPRGQAQQALVLDPLPQSSRDLCSLNSQSTAPPQDPSQKTDSGQNGSQSGSQSGSKIDSPQPKTDPNQIQTGTQTKRILWIVPNFRSVSADTYLPPQSFKEKLWLATQESFDYSAFIYEGIVAGISMAQKSEPSFGQGASGYGIYYAHTFADGTIENYMVEAFVPAATKEDPRYYTLGHGGIFKRTGYAVSRLLITRNDAGNNTFNFSEVIGAGAAAGIGNLYYPPQNTWVKTYQRWGSQILQDGLSFIAREFWPDINRAVFHNKY
jgi:hypothetical protein